MSFIMRLIRLIIVFLPLIHYFTSYKKVNSNSLFSGASIIWTSESQCLLTPFFVFFHFFSFYKCSTDIGMPVWARTGIPSC